MKATHGEKRRVLVTGGNAGIGKATAVALAKRGDDVVITVRDSAKGERAAQDIRAKTGRDVTWMIVDLAALESVRCFTDEFVARYSRLDVLINNAGLILGERRVTDDGFEETFAVNHLGPFLLTTRLLPLLRSSAPSRIVNVSSRMHVRAIHGIDFDDVQRNRRYRAMEVYAESKLANLLFTSELARRLAGTGVTANAVHPGVVATNFSLDGDADGIIAWFYRWAAPFMRTPERGAETSVYVATHPDLDGISGGYFASCRRRKPSRAARDDEAARRLWRLSEQWVQEPSTNAPSTDAR